MGHPPFAALRSVLGNRAGVPIGWRNSVAAGTGLVIGAGLGQAIDMLEGGGTLVVSALTGMFLGLLAVAGPFYMALRLMLTVGLLMILTSGLAALAVAHAWLAVGGMVALVFLSTVWTAIPLVGAQLGSFPTIVYLLILAKGESFTGGATAGRVMIAAAAGVIGALIVLLIFSGSDPRKSTRALVAKAWGPTATSRQQGSMLMILRLDSSPRSLMTVGQAAILATIARGWLDSYKDSSTYASGLKAQDAIGAALTPRGSIVPRAIDSSVGVARAQMEDAATSVHEPAMSFAWSRWRVALEFGAGVLEGRREPRKVEFSSASLIRALLRSVLHMDASTFRYGIQRALALGVATFVMVNSQLPSFYWVLLATFAALQTNAIATVSKAAQYAFGTWIGAVGAVVLSVVLPEVTVKVVALALILAGFAWMARNYMIMSMAVAAAVVLLTGAPNGDYLPWAGLRALDVTCGALAAIAVSGFILRVRPRPDLHLAQAREALGRTVSQLRLRFENPRATPRTSLFDESRLFRAAANLETDIQLTRDSTALASELNHVMDLNDQVLSLASVIFQTAAGSRDQLPAGSQELIGKGLSHLDTKIDGIGLPRKT